MTVHIVFQHFDAQESRERQVIGVYLDLERAVAFRDDAEQLSLTIRQTGVTYKIETHKAIGANHDQ